MIASCIRSLVWRTRAGLDLQNAFQAEVCKTFLSFSAHMDGRDSRSPERLVYLSLLLLAKVLCWWSCHVIICLGLREERQTQGELFKHQ